MEFFRKTWRKRVVTLFLDFDFRCTLVGLNLTVNKLRSPRGSCGRHPRLRKMRAGSPAQRLHRICRIVLCNSREPIRRLAIIVRNRDLKRWLFWNWEYMYDLKVDSWGCARRAGFHTSYDMVDVKTLKHACGWIEQKNLQQKLTQILSKA